MEGLPVAVSDIGVLVERVTDGMGREKFWVGDSNHYNDTLSWFLADDGWKSWNIQKPQISAHAVRDYDNLYQSFLS